MVIVLVSVVFIVIVLAVQSFQLGFRFILRVSSKLVVVVCRIVGVIIVCRIEALSHRHGNLQLRFRARIVVPSGLKKIGTGIAPGDQEHALALFRRRA